MHLQDELQRVDAMLMQTAIVNCNVADVRYLLCLV